MNSTSRAARFVTMPTRSPGLFDGRARGRAKRHAQLVGDHVGQRRLAETGRPVQQHVIERLAALRGRRNRDLKVFAHAVLPDVVVEHARPEAGFVLRSSSTRAAVTIRSSDRGLPAQCRAYFASSRRACFSVCSKLAVRCGLDGRIDRFFGKRPMIPQVHQRREHIVAQRERRQRPLRSNGRSSRSRGSRSFSSRTIRSEVFLPTPGNRRQPREIAPLDGPNELVAARCPRAPPAPPSGRCR